MAINRKSFDFPVWPKFEMVATNESWVFLSVLVFGRVFEMDCR